MDISRPQSRPWILVALLIASIMLAYLISFTPMFEALELRLLDYRFILRGEEEPAQNPIVIIAIDDQSDESTPHRWPWPRSYFAHVIENLEEAGAAVIAVDVIFDKPDKYGAEHDERFAEVLQQYDNVVLTGKLLRTQGRYTYSTLIPPYEKFLGDTTKTPWGLAAIEADVDGFYRRYQFAQMFHDSLYPSLAAQAIRIYEDLPPDSKLRFTEGNLDFGPMRIPTEGDLGFLINYLGPAGSFPQYSFDNVLDDNDFELAGEFDLNAFDDPDFGLVHDDIFKDRIVLIGSTMQELHDNFPTPFLEHTASGGKKARAETPGVEIHANAILTVLNQRYLHHLPALVNFAIVLLFSLLIYAAARRLKIGWGVFSLFVLLGGYIVLSFIFFSQYRIIFLITTPVLSVLFTYTSISLYQYLLAQKEKQMLRGAFAHYVPEKVVQEIIENPDKLTLGGEERIITVLFSDIAGFTTISEGMRPRELVRLLNEYLTEMTAVILKHDGIIDKFEGDAIMAEFGMPVPMENHAQAACTAALEMQIELRRIRNKWLNEGRPEIKARIGINTGEVIVGNMGSKDVFDYTVMGDQVNLGARLESANKYYDTNIMISEFTQQHVKDAFLTRPLDLLRVKGKQKPIAVFELIGYKDTKFTDNFLEMLENYNQGIVLYRKQQWDGALELFAKCIDLKPEDTPSRIYHKRCLVYRNNPPPMDWDGVTTLQEK